MQKAKQESKRNFTYSKIKCGGIAETAERGEKTPIEIVPVAYMPLTRICFDFT